MTDFAKALDDRTLTIWALRLQGITPAQNLRAYLWQQIARVELRRRHRDIDVLTLDCCPQCGVIGRWWRHRQTGEVVCLACSTDGGVS